MDDSDITRILAKAKVVAVVGLSRNPSKDSYRVASYLLSRKYRIVPINPTADTILHQKSYQSLLGVPPSLQATIDIVDIFRPSEEVSEIVSQAIELRRRFGKPDVVWMQLGVVNPKAAEMAQKANLLVVMDKCMMQEHSRLFGEKEDPELEKIKAKKMKQLTEELQHKMPSTVIEVTDSNLEKTISGFRLVVVDCWAVWCGPCRIISPIIEELAKEYEGKIVFGKLNVDENPKVAARFNIMGIPTLLIMKDGKEVDRLVGAVPKHSIEKTVNKHV